MSNEVVVNSVSHRKDESQPDLVIVRTYSAGVHVGELESCDGKIVKLRNAKRIWRWWKAWTLNEVATTGVCRTEKTRISCAVDEITLTEAIEIIKVTEKAAETFESVWND